MTTYQTRAGLSVATELCELIEQEMLPGTGLAVEPFWAGFAEVIRELSPCNRELLSAREQLQQQIDRWHSQHPQLNAEEYQQFLREIGYLVPEGEDFQITTEQVDTEICAQAGPQLVVPVKNARFALNAANARWGSLYDALYGTDVIPEDDGAQRGGQYNPVRGQKVIDFGRAHLDQLAPLETGTYAQAVSFEVAQQRLSVRLADGATTALKRAEQFVGWRGNGERVEAVLLRHHGLHVEIQLDPKGSIGQTDPAGIQDILCEAALSTIMDCEDSVAAVDAEDKTEVYRNWLGLMKGTLTASFEKDGNRLTRRLSPDRRYVDPAGEPFCLPGRSLLFVRNVGHLMTNCAILDEDHREVPEGVMDAVVTSLAALHDLNKPADSPFRNSRCGSVYIVKPKMHGPDEVAFSVTLFARVEALLKLPENTLKIGIMDEERRTTVNLKECIRAAKARTVFINTGFLDRTGDEIHTSMRAGPFVPKTQMKQQAWIDAYERWNVDVGLACGLQGRAQIGKGMWAMPDQMAAMMEEKIAHPLSGANTAWVPSPNAATLHSIHYHRVDVVDQWEAIKQRPRASLDDLLSIPLLAPTPKLSAELIQAEIDNNVQGILGYVVRWIDQGIGCSKVPDIHDVGLMEDRATLRISSQSLANWILHGVCTEDQVRASFQRMAKVVDQQNEADADYQSLNDDVQGVAFQAACALVFEGVNQPNGYTEPLLHEYRLLKKSQH